MAKCWKLKMWHFEHNIMGHWLYSWSAPNLTKIDPHNNWVINLVVNFSCHATRRDSKVVDEPKTKKIIGSKVDVPNKIQDTDLCITKSVVKLIWARKKQTPTHAAKMRRVKLNTRQRFMWPTKNHMCCGSKNGATIKYKAPISPCCYCLNVAVALTLPPCCQNLNDISLSLLPCWFRLVVVPLLVSP